MWLGQLFGCSAVKGCHGGWVMSSLSHVWIGTSTGNHDPIFGRERAARKGTKTTTEWSRTPVESVADGGSYTRDTRWSEAVSVRRPR